MRPFSLEELSGIANNPQYSLFFNNGQDERQEKGTLRVLSLFSGCGGMDLGLEGGFICHNHLVTNKNWIRSKVSDNWVLLQRNQFRIVFACDILEEARLTWLRYMSRYHINPEIYHLESIVDLVKLHRSGNEIFPKNIDVVTGGFPCQDFSVAGMNTKPLQTFTVLSLPSSLPSELPENGLYLASNNTSSVILT